MAEKILEVKDLHVKVEGKEILKGVNLAINQGEVHALMGPNGAGKSTLSNVLMGHPKYEVTRGSIRFLDNDLLEMGSSERAVAGMFLSFQHPFEVQGLGFTKFLYAAYKATHPKEKATLFKFKKIMKEKLEMLQMDPKFGDRELNVGFSGGEKKRAEILQMAVLNPKLALLDETDSGLDIDSLKLVSQAVNKMKGPGFSALVITHYNRILEYLKPDFVHVFVDGRIVSSGTKELADRLEQKGYKALLKELGVKGELTAMEVSSE